MEMKDPKMMAIGTSVFALLNLWWIYLYTLIGIRFQDVFNPMIFIDFIGNYGAIFLMILIGVLMAASIFMMRLFSNYLSMYERTIMGAAGVLIPVILMMGLFTNVLMFFVIMLFYMVGCIIFVGAKGEDGLLPRMKRGMEDSRKVVSVIAVGALLMSLLYVYGNYEDSKAMFKEAMVKVQSDINIGELLTREDVKEMVLGSLPAKEELLDASISSAADAYGLTEDQIRSNPVLMEALEEAVDAEYEKQLANIDDTVDQYYSKITSQSSDMVSPIMEKMFERPPLKYMLDFLPILVAVLVASMVSFFGMIIVSPVGAVLGMFVPAKPERPKQPPQGPQQTQNQ